MTTEQPQPEYCDCPGFHDGSCHARQIAALHKKNAVLRDEVRAWRDADARHDLTHFLGDMDNEEVLVAMAVTDAAGALEE